jgi:uncharacterized protein
MTSAHVERTHGVDLEANKEVVRQLFTAFSNGRFDDARALTDPDGSWWMLSRRAAGTIEGYLTGFAGAIDKLFPAGLRFELGSITAEQDRVAVQAECEGRTVMGKDYRNAYHFLFRLEGGRVVAGWEYGDTLHAEQVLRG